MLGELEEALQTELAQLEYPPRSWVIPKDGIDHDVVIIGAGMAGLAAAFALFKEGIDRLQLYDARCAGFEGPWNTYARMLTLRSGKQLAGPALGISSLTFHAWYEAKVGKERWDSLYKIPTGQWMEYLSWYKKVLGISVENSVKMLTIAPEKSRIKLELDRSGAQSSVYARKVILATGREGFGGMNIPAFMQSIPKELYAHTSESIDFQSLSGLRVGIVGVGASGFDAAACALQAGAKEVDMLLRDETIPKVNKGLQLYYPGFTEGYFELSDQERWEFMRAAYQRGAPPPFESLDRVSSYPNLKVIRGFSIQRAECVANQVVLQNRAYDFVILATGFLIDGAKEKELSAIYPDILLWGDRKIEKKVHYPAQFDRFPYLGSHFQFLPKDPQKAAYLKDIYCFNYAATLSHGQLSGDIPGVSVGAARLAQGIARDLFHEDAKHYLEELKQYNHHDFEEAHYGFF